MEYDRLMIKFVILCGVYLNQNSIDNNCLIIYLDVSIKSIFQVLAGAQIIS